MQCCVARRRILHGWWVQLAPVSDADLRHLILELQHAYAGELAAGFAYAGHWRSVHDLAEREHIRQIEDEEHHHRELVGGLLRELGAKPRPLRNAVFITIGKVLGALCHISGWFLPMYGAGRLERRNIMEYERAAMYATRCGHEPMIDCLIDMAEVEWEHEYYFRHRVIGHRMLRILPLWSAAPPKEEIRKSLAAEPSPACGRRCPKGG
jgi:ferritin-like protein